MVYLTYHTLKINIINVLNIVQISRCSVTQINNISLLIIRKRNHKAPLITNRNKSATRGAHLVPIVIPTTC